jgi:uncharacterized protein
MQTPVMSKGGEHLPPDLSRIAQELQIRKVHVENVVQMLDEGNTVPFITRYRKERTGSLDEEMIRQIQARVTYLRQLSERKQTILKSIDGQGKLTEELRTALLDADTSKRLEDLYVPYKPKKRTLATVARERGLEPLAQAIWSRDPAVANLSEVLPGMVNPEKELKTTDDVLLGVQHILAEQVAETADVRAAVRVVLWETGKLNTSKSDRLPEGRGLEYKDYFQFTEAVRQIPPHRILAINRGEKEGPLKVQMEWDAEAVRRVALEKLPLADHPHAELLQKVTEDALARLLLPSLEREIRSELTEEAEDHAIGVFARNLRSLLLQPPLRGRRVLAVDPAFRTGCKLAALDEVGNLLEDGVIYPFGKGEKGKGRGGADKRGAAKAKDQSAESLPPAAGSTAPGTTIGPLCPDLITACLAPAPALIMVVSGPPPETAAMPPTPHIDPETGAAFPPADPILAAPPAVDSLPVVAAVGQDSDPAVAAGVGSQYCLTAAAVPPARSSRLEAKSRLMDLVRRHHLNVIALGNGTACRETEELISELIAESVPDLAYVIVNEAGASVYSASAVGREEFPHHDATLRGTISIGRRLQDPLSELVKIDPQNVGVGLYQHDLPPPQLKESLRDVIESCVNHVGVDLNTASVPLLRHVSGLNQLIARSLVDHRKKHGPFKNREQLLQVPALGPKRFVQAAGFLRIAGGDNPLDQTRIHPESYPVALRLLADLQTNPEALRDRAKTRELRGKLKDLSTEELSTRLQTGVPTLQDIFDALAKPGRDPREDLPPPIFRKGILKLEDLQPGMELKGTVLNVVDFGAFVDVGLKESGLIHISQMANRYVRNPYDLLSVGDVVSVWVQAVDKERRRVSLTLIKPGGQRGPREKRGGRRPARPQRESAPRHRPPHTGQGRAVAEPKQGQSTAAPTPEPTPAAATSPPPQPVVSPSPPTSRPPARPRKPQRSQPKPKLSKAALEGTAPLRTFGELKAYFEAQKQGPEASAPHPNAGSDNSAS